MSTSSLITILALIASVSAEPYILSYGTYPYPQNSAYAAAFYNPAAGAPLPAAYPAEYTAAYSPASYSPAYSPASYTAAYSPASYTAAYSPASYSASYVAPFYGAYSAPLQLPAVSAFGSSYRVEELAAPYNPVSSIAAVAPVAPLTYPSPYSYVYKR